MDYGIAAGTLNQNVSDGTLVTAHNLTLTGLAPDTAYYYRVTAVDQDANAATYPAVGTAPLSFTLPAPRLSDTLAADFAQGVAEGCYIGQAGNGALLLSPAFGTEFDGVVLPGDWSPKPWNTGGSATIGDGALKVDARADRDFCRLRSRPLCGVRGYLRGRAIPDGRLGRRG